MTPARLAFYSTLLAGGVGFGLLAFVVLLVGGVGPFGPETAPVVMAATVLTGLVALSLLISWLLKSNAARGRITLVNEDGNPRAITGGNALGFVFGAIWRFIVVGVVTHAVATLLKNAYGAHITAVDAGAIDLVTFAANWFLAFWWVYAAPYGSHRILFAPSSVTAAQARAPVPMSIASYSDLQDSASFLKEAVTGTLGVIAAISYYGLGLLQLAAIVSFFHLVWGWWLIISIIVAMFIAYMPIVGALSGIYAAVYAWNWSWYAAVSLFCFPLLVWAAIVLIAGTAAATQALFRGRVRRADF